MFTPSAFAVEDERRVVEFVAAHPFATLVTGRDELTASHVPLLVDRAHGGWRLRGHLARANPHAEALDGAHALAIFMGPHGYVSPRWYRDTPAVPTWNYAAAELRGRVRVVDSDATRAIVDDLATVFEPDRAAWSLAGLPQAFAERMLGAIIGFEIEVTDMQAKFKMSQNRSAADRHGVIQALEAGGAHAGRALAAFMRDLDSPVGR